MPLMGCVAYILTTDLRKSDYQLGIADATSFAVRRSTPATQIEAETVEAIVSGCWSRRFVSLTALAAVRRHYEGRASPRKLTRSSRCGRRDCKYPAGAGRREPAADPAAPGADAPPDAAGGGAGNRAGCARRGEADGRVPAQSAGRRVRGAHHARRGARIRPD